MINQKSPASEAIALLIELAQKGEIDPWDVQVITVIDRFLDELGLGNSNNKIYQETDLSHSGQVILWGSMLVLFKAKTLAKLEQEEEEIEIVEDLEIIANSDDNNHKLPSNLEQQIRRRTSALPPKNRKVTLGELIAQLEEIAKEIEKTTVKDSIVKKPRNYARQETINAINQLAHNENLTELATQLEQFFQEDLPLLVSEPTIINFEQLLNWWSERNEQKIQDKVGVFWALLLLSSQSKVELSQEEFYQDLHINVIIKD